jgi:hypothetical protein
LVVTALCVIVATFVLLQAAPRFFFKVSTYIGAKIALLLMVLWFLVAGFREDDFPVPFAGLGSIVLVCLLLIVIVIPLIRNTVLAPVFRLLTNVASVLIVLMGLYTVSVSVDLWHNLFIINEMITPLTSLIAYSSFIPQYMNVFQFFPWFLDLVGVTQFPDLTMQIIYVFLQFMSIVTIALAVSLNYHFMHKRSLFLALLFTVPLFFISSRPFWDYSKNYYTVQLFTYSLVPVRMFTVFSIGCIAVFLLHKNTQDTRKSLMYASLCGIFAGIGVYQSNDFGLFAAIAVAATIVLQPFQPLLQRMYVVTTYVLSVCLGVVLLLVSNIEITALNSSYLFWFQRSFGTGFGGLPILFPGNGFMVIISVLATWFCVLHSYFVLRRNATVFSQDPLIARNFTAVLFVATTSVFGMSYYINRSVISFQGSSMYICWSISLFLLYQLHQRIRVNQPKQPFLRYSNLAFNVLLCVPVAIALIYTPVPSRLNPDEIAIKTIFTTAANEMIETRDYKLLKVNRLKAAYKVVHKITPKTAFVGRFANVVQLYTKIPAANVFTHPVNSTIGKPALQMYCNQMTLLQYDVYLTDDKVLCENMDLLTSKKLGIRMYLRKNYEQTNPKEWAELRDIAKFVVVKPKP